MLLDFFRLNSPVRTINQMDLLSHLGISRDLRDALYEPSHWPDALKKVEKTNFVNVSLSKTTFSGITFTECVFRDCLFIGCDLNNVDFHRCRFIDCNFYKSKFNECYLDPNVFSFNHKYRKTHSNVGVGLYQTLLENSSRMKQIDFERNADLHFRRWQRDQLDFDAKINKISKFELFLQKSKNWLYEKVAGYGYKPFRYVVSTVLLFTLISILNMWLLNDNIEINGKIISEIDFSDSLFYTYSMMTALGFSSILPSTPFSKVYAIIMALVGIGWLGIFTSLLVKRFIK